MEHLDVWNMQILQSTTRAICQTHHRYMLEAIGAGATITEKGAWAEIWMQSDEYKRITEEIETICNIQKPTRSMDISMDDKEYAMPFISQLRTVTKRTFTSYWRDPNYLLGK